MPTVEGSFGESRRWSDKNRRSTRESESTNNDPSEKNEISGEDEFTETWEDLCKKYKAIDWTTCVPKKTPEENVMEDNKTEPKQESKELEIENLVVDRKQQDHKAKRQVWDNFDEHCERGDAPLDEDAADLKVIKRELYTIMEEDEPEDEEDGDVPKRWKPSSSFKRSPKMDAGAGAEPLDRPVANPIFVHAVPNDTSSDDSTLVDSPADDVPTLKNEICGEFQSSEEGSIDVELGLCEHATTDYLTSDVITLKSGICGEFHSTEDHPYRDLELGLVPGEPEVTTWRDRWYECTYSPSETYPDDEAGGESRQTSEVPQDTSATVLFDPSVGNDDVTPPSGSTAGKARSIYLHEDTIDAVMDLDGPTLERLENANPYKTPVPEWNQPKEVKPEKPKKAHFWHRKRIPEPTTAPDNRIQFVDERTTEVLFSAEDTWEEYRSKASTANTICVPDPEPPKSKHVFKRMLKGIRALCHRFRQKYRDKSTETSETASATEERPSCLKSKHNNNLLEETSRMNICDQVDEEELDEFDEMYNKLRFNIQGTLPLYRKKQVERYLERVQQQEDQPDPPPVGE